MSDINNIYNLYMENAAKQQPTMTTTSRGSKIIVESAARAKLEVYSDMKKWLEDMIINYGD